MSTLTYVSGDATELQHPTKYNTIVHCCNDKGGWGAGFVLSLSKKWPHVEQEYRQWAKGELRTPFELGRYMISCAEQGIYVCNIIGQHDVRPDRFGYSPIRYGAIHEALWHYALQIKHTEAFKRGEHSVHMPQMGAGLAGGNWNIIESIVKDTLVDSGIPVTVYVYTP